MIVVAIVVSAPAALAQAVQYRSGLSIQLIPSWVTWNGKVIPAYFQGLVSAHVNPNCFEHRMVELFQNGIKIGSDKTKTDSDWLIKASTPTPPGKYVAKVKKRALHANELQGKEKRVICKAAQSKVLTVP